MINEYPYFIYPIFDTAKFFPTYCLLGYYIGGWPSELSIYGGDENFINFALAALGRNVNIFPGRPLFYYTEKRGYSWNYTDWLRNRCIAACLSGGTAFAMKFVQHAKGNPPVKGSILHDVLEKCAGHREHFWPNLKVSLEDWVAKWT